MLIRPLVQRNEGEDREIPNGIRVSLSQRRFCVQSITVRGHEFGVTEEGVDLILGVRMVPDFPFRSKLNQVVRERDGVPTERGE